MRLLRARHAEDLLAVPQDFYLMLPQIMLRHGVAARFTQMRARSGHYGQVAQLTSVQSGIHHAVVRQWADMNQVGIDFAQCLGEARHAE